MKRNRLKMANCAGLTRVAMLQFRVEFRKERLDGVKGFQVARQKHERRYDTTLLPRAIDSR